MLKSVRQSGPSEMRFACSFSAHLAGNDANYARRIADVASARLWLTDGVPFSDAITMVEVSRRFELSANDCRVYAVEIVFEAQQEVRNSNHQQTANQEEIQNAVA